MIIAHRMAEGVRMDWQGQTVIVTGSTRGIGAATAELFASQGAHVVVHGLEVDEGEALVAKLRDGGARASFAGGDLCQPDVPARLVAHAVEQTGRLDVLVNNAGANIFAGTTGADLATWQRCLDLDLRAGWLAAQAAVKADAGLHAIVNVASNHARATFPGVFPYNVAKAGLLALTQSLAIELAPQGVRANAVCPGWTATHINQAMFAADPDERARVERLHPLARIGRPEEVAWAIRFLASEVEASFITGTVLTVDGGRSALLQDPAS